MKRIAIISGHYGCGKTNVAVNLAISRSRLQSQVALADLDIVNPYFRSKDSELELSSHGIEMICSAYANSNVDIPALPQEIYRITDDKSLHCILDVGGDDRGALVLGRLAPAIKEEDDYEMLYVVNRFRPLTSSPEAALELMREIENACTMHFTGIINNSNLGRETTRQDILSSLSYGEEISIKADLPLLATTVASSLFNTLNGQIPNLYPLKLQAKI